jgi:hypothetical protein
MYLCFNTYFGSFHRIYCFGSTNVSLIIFVRQSHSMYIRPLHSHFIRDTFPLQLWIYLCKFNVDTYNSAYLVNPSKEPKQRSGINENMEK